MRKRATFTEPAIEIDREILRKALCYLAPVFALEVGVPIGAVCFR